MVRRSTVDRSPQPDLYSAGYDPGAESQPAGAGKRSRSGSGWRGAGGRWLVWTFRVVVWAVLLIIGYRGVMAIVLNETPPSKTPSAPAAPATSGFPVQEASAYAMQFGQVYLNASPATAGQRARELAPFLPPGNTPSAPAAPATSGFPVQEASAYALQFGQVYLNASPRTATQRASQLAPFLPPGTPDQQLGWNGGGSLNLQSEQVAGVRVQDSQHAVVTLLARVNGNMMELGVPVYAAAGGLGISGQPAWLPAPKSVVQPAPPTVNTDSAAESELMGQLPEFFRAYASGDQSTLGRFLAPGTSLTGLGGTVIFGSVTGVTAPVGGTTRHIVATVVWEIPGAPAKGTQAGNTTANLEMTYALTIVRQHGTWYVQSVAPSTQAGGQP